MIVKTGATCVDGKMLGDHGSEFVPIDKDASAAIFTRPMCKYVAVYERNDKGSPYICIRPYYKIPPFAVDEDEFHRFIFNLPDDRAMHLLLDTQDGEIRYMINMDGSWDEERIRDSIEDALDYLQDEVYPAIIDFVKSAWKRR